MLRLVESVPPPSLRTMLRNVRNPLWSAAALVIVVEGMRAASDILVPITVSAMLAVICSPAVGWLTKRRVPNILAVVAVVLGMLVLVAGIGVLVGASLAGFRDSIPAYRTRFAGLFDGTLAWLQSHGIRIERSDVLASARLQRAAEASAGFLVDSLSKLGAVLTNTFLVFLTMILILAEGPTVPGRLRALAGNPEADISAYARIATEVQSYLAIKSVLSIVNGVCVGVMAAVLGVDFAVLWGLVAALLNYIPNIGLVLAAIPAVLLALIQHGPATALLLALGYGVIGTVIGNVIEPMWMGRKLGLSITVVFLSLVVWNWIWGPVGMLLSVPLTMILKIMLSNSREWSFIADVLDSGEAVEKHGPAEPLESLASLPPRGSSVPPRGSSVPPRGSSVPPEDESPPTSRTPVIPDETPLGDDAER